MKLTRYSTLVVLVLALLGGAFAVAPRAMAEAKPDDEKAVPVEEVDDAGPTVTITGGDVTTSTTVDISADGGVAISDASGGDENFAFDSADAVVEVEDDDQGGVLGLRDELIGGDDVVAGDIAAAGNGGTADASADGGSVTVGDINSGGNSGNTIEVGNVGAPQPAPEAPKPVAPKPEAPKPVAPKPEAPKPVAPKDKDAAPKDADQGDDEGSDDDGNGGNGNGGNGNGGNGGGGSDVSSLPATGAGLVLGETGANDALIALAALGAVGAAGYGLRRRFV